LEHDIGIVNRACNEVCTSPRFRKLMGIVLNVGNKLNNPGENGPSGAATAFTIHSLLKLNQAKSVDRKTTFLHFVVQVAKRNDECLIHFKKELSSVFKAEKIFWDHCSDGVKELEAELNNVKKLAIRQIMSNSSLSSMSISIQELENSNMSDFPSEVTDALSQSFVGKFLLLAIEKISLVRKEMERSNQSYSQLLDYFHEQGNMQPHEVFSILIQFSKNFDTAKSEIEKNEKAEERQKKLLKKQGARNNNEAKESSFQTKMDSTLDQLNKSDNLRNTAKCPKKSNIGNKKTSTPKNEPCFGSVLNELTAKFKAKD